MARLLLALLFLTLLSCSVIVAAEQKSDTHTEEADAPVDVEDAEHVGAESGSEDETSDGDDEEYDDDHYTQVFLNLRMCLYAHAIPLHFIRWILRTKKVGSRFLTQTKMAR